MRYAGEAVTPERPSSARTHSYSRAQTPASLHGDLHPANVLVNDGQVSGVIDFGDITAGDPASDLSVAWKRLISKPFEATTALLQRDSLLRAAVELAADAGTTRSWCIASCHVDRLGAVADDGPRPVVLLRVRLRGGVPKAPWRGR